MTGRAASPPDSARSEPLLWQSPASAPAFGEGPWAISCDFDGTITREDLVQSILERFAGPAWREIELEWEAGRIDSRVCLRQQTRLLRVSEDELAGFVDAAAVDADAAGLFADCAQLGLDVRVVSDGYDWVIRRVMSRLGVSDVPIFANRLTFDADRRCDVAFPYAASGCGGGTCKCRVTDRALPRLHIGDGRSDVCISNACDLVFAKGALLASRRGRNLNSVAFSSFADIRAVLPGLANTRAKVASAPPFRQSQDPR